MKGEPRRIRPLSPHPAPSNDAPERGHAFLRRRTRDRHEAVEAAFQPFDITTLRGMGQFLRAQAAAVTGLESALDQADAAALLPDWPERRRTAAILADLDHMAVAKPSPLAVDLPTDAHRLGAIYVLEGSRLGGRVLSRIAATSSDPEVRAATRFLDHQAGAGTWQNLRARLDTFEEVGEAELEAILEGAMRAFALFQHAAESEARGELA